MRTKGYAPFTTFFFYFRLCMIDGSGGAPVNGCAEVVNAYLNNDWEWVI